MHMSGVPTLQKYYVGYMILYIKGQLRQETLGNGKFYMPSMESYSARNVRLQDYCNKSSLSIILKLLRACSKNETATYFAFEKMIYNSFFRSIVC